MSGGQRFFIKREDDMKKRKARADPKELEFSKVIMKQEMQLLWINTIGVLGLAFYCVHNSFDAAFPWLSAMVSLPWAAWGVSKTGYTMKSVKENTSGGIVYESAMSFGNGYTGGGSSGKISCNAIHRAAEEDKGMVAFGSDRGREGAGKRHRAVEAAVCVRFIFATLSCGCEKDFL